MSTAEAHDLWDDAPRSRRAAVAQAEPRLSRADAAAFADAFDIDDAFGAPTGRFARAGEAESREIILERGPVADDASDAVPVLAVVADDAESPAAVEPGLVLTAEAIEEELVGAPVIDPVTGRRTVQITGHPGQAVAPRRLQDVENRRARRGGVTQRALARPDHIALYAVLLGLFLVVLAAASSSAHP